MFSVCACVRLMESDEEGSDPMRAEPVADLDRKYWRSQNNIILRLLDSIISIMLQKMVSLT